jgi:hypothetical protein
VPRLGDAAPPGVDRHATVVVEDRHLANIGLLVVAEQPSQRVWS